jgi:hypothetical protein
MDKNNGNTINVNQQTTSRKIVNSKDLLMLSLSKFYTKTTINKILPIIEGESNISLRLIDWFVTNYSKKYNTVITKEKNNNIIHFNVYLSYRSQLKAYSKQLFDPFRRRDRITFFYDKDSNIETTIGQLNFFRWIIQNDILEYIIINIKAVESDMINIQKENQNKKNNDDNMRVKLIQTDKGIVIQKRKKRIQLSKSSIKNMNLTSGQRKIEFE